jgi:hypothetical protein
MPTVCIFEGMRKKKERRTRTRRKQKRTKKKLFGDAMRWRWPIALLFVLYCPMSNSLRTNNSIGRTRVEEADGMDGMDWGWIGDRETHTHLQMGILFRFNTKYCGKEKSRSKGNRERKKEKEQQPS